MPDPYEAVTVYMESEDVAVNGWKATDIVQTVLQAVDYKSCVLCPDCGSEIDTRTAEAL